MEKNNSPNSKENNVGIQENIVIDIDRSKLYNFPNHPFKVRDDEKMAETVDSIKEYGVLMPLLVRLKQDGNYEIISGHRRKRACELANVSKIPCLVRQLTDDEATIIMVDSNIQREKLLPSEKAFAYKMKLDALRHQGKRTDLIKELTSDQVEPKLKNSIEQLVDMWGDSVSQIKRYIRLTYLMPELLEMVDEERLSFTTAVELSYLTEEEQANLLETMEIEERTPSYAQALKMKEMSKQGTLDMDAIFKIMIEAKGNEQEQLKFKVNDLKSYFPKNYTIKQMENVIQKLLEGYQKQWQRKLQDRDSR
ncbi:MAG: ParB/RepB/Spo0J family partition protein [Clostridia bacterium]|nr:ParB/RepB/Spo0J family partition protein [Clostridia bacterium]